MRARIAAAAAALALAWTFGLALGAPFAWAASDCEEAFERWARLSNSEVQPMRGAGRGACVSTEAARQSLLSALDLARRECGDASDPGLQQTRTLININQSFITSLGACRTESAGVGEGWVTKAAPVPEPPRAAPPPPPLPPASPPPAPLVGGPRPSVITPAPAPAAPRTAAVVPLAAAPKPESAVPAPSPPCLEVSARQGDIYPLLNRRCRGYTVLAVIETRTASGETSCKGYAVGAGVNLRGPLAPRVNYECLSGQAACSKERLGDMFPECDW